MNKVKEDIALFGFYFDTAYLLGDTVAVLVLPLVGRDQLRQKTDRHHLGAQKQRSYGINKQGSFMQRQKGAGLPEIDHPGDAQINHAQGTGGKTPKGCNGLGVYKFSRPNENTLTFTLVSDTCKDRKRNVLLAWHQK